MKIIKTSKDMRSWSDAMHTEGKTIAFVPTMGFLHEGHLSLMDIGKSLCSTLAVSIFVNPTQFGANEDLDAYPTNIERDLELAKKHGAQAIFLPDKSDIYPAGYQSYVSLEHLPAHLCGLSRPEHFRGVTTVVTKLFNIVRPDTAVFGSKDYQQLQIIKQLNKDLDFNINIVGAPIVRESDGLAMSSRNAYLKPEERESALSLSRSRLMAESDVKSGEKSAATIKSKIKKFIESFDHTKIDYISICNPETLDEIDIIEGKTLLALAVHVGKARLIDNIILEK
ncbi:Pantothenate synthetase [Desulfamplus magnetovallimortis]|uniref:Pantothenate synthetase n=1 Tax=Desulfamplus magnetovallimortis TaxID=1246637 RepID=A0A1W1H7B8_9BACT|nr:pantoate--beta-alanine ligase [Desulfamplus magnetovallimortis]SLM28326.1 Pantothenate synthetase [Desulfamplus magnetovallimortis]